MLYWVAGIVDGGISMSGEDGPPHVALARVANKGGLSGAPIQIPMTLNFDSLKKRVSHRAIIRKNPVVARHGGRVGDQVGPAGTGTRAGITNGSVGPSVGVDRPRRATTGAGR